MRPAAWALTALVVLGFAILLVARSGWPAERARAWVASWVSTYLGRELSIEELSIELLPFAVEARGVTLAGRLPGDPPLATARRVVLEASPRRLLARQPELQRLLVEEPRLHLAFAEDGSHNIPLPARRGGRATGRQLTIGTLEVVAGELALEEMRLPLALEARQVGARLVAEGPTAWVGSAVAQEVETRVADLEPYLGGLRVKMRLNRQAFELVDGHLAGPDLEARLRGEWRWGGEKRLGLEIEAQAQGALLARLGWSDEIAGPLRFHGALARTPADWELRGRLTSERLVLAGRPLEQVDAALALEQGRVRVAPFTASYHGGPIEGSVEVAFGAPASIAVAASLAGSDLQGVLADQGMELEGVAGTIAGRLEYRCTSTAPTAGDGWAELSIEAATGEAGELPVAGSAPLLIEDGVIASRAVQLMTPAATIEAAGSYDLQLRHGRFDFTAAIDDAGRLLAALDPTHPAEPPLWRPTAGAGQAEGSLEVEPAGWRLTVAPDLEGVAAPGYAADRLHGAVTLTAAAVEDLRLELERPQAALLATGRVPFAGEGLALAVEAAAWPWSDLRPWLPMALPVEGAVTGSLELAGSLEALTGSARAAVAPVTVAGLPAERLETELAFDAGGLRLERLALAAPAGEVRAAGTLGAGEAGRFDLTLASTPLDLAQPPFSERLVESLTGTLEVNAALAGTLAEPDLTASLVARGLALGERALGERGEARLDLEWRDGRARASGGLLGLLAVEGGGPLDAERADLRLGLASPDLRTLAQLFVEAPLPAVDGRFAGSLSVAGRWAEPRDLDVAFEAREIALTYEGRQLALLEPARARWSEEGLQIDSLYLGEEATASEFFVFGLLPAAGGELDLRLQLALASQWAQPWLPGWRLGEGRFEAIGAVRGTPERPLLFGQGELSQSSLVVPGVPGSIEELSGWVLFDPGRLTLDSFRARFAGGELRAAGSVALFPAPGQAGAWELQASAADLPLRYPEGWLLRGDAEALLQSTAEGRRLRGVVDLDRAYYLEDVPVGVVQLLQGVFARQRIEVEETEELLATTELNLLVRGPGALRVRNNVARLDGSLDLAVRGSLARPVLFGSVEVAPGGTLVYADNEYEVQRGELTFANPYRIEPIIDLAATTELREYDVTLTLSGTLERLDVSLASDPPLADLDVLALLTAGDQPAAPRVDDPLAPRDEQEVSAHGLLYGQAAAAVGSRFRSLFGLDKFRIDPLTESSGDLSSARITVGEQLGRDLFATYSYDPSTTEQEILQLEWQVGRGITLIATQNGDGTYAVDVRREKTF